MYKIRNRKRPKVVIDLNAGITIAPNDIDVVIIPKETNMDGDMMSMAKAERERQAMERYDEMERDLTPELTMQEMVLAITAMWGAADMARRVGDEEEARAYDRIYNKLLMQQKLYCNSQHW